VTNRPPPEGRPQRQIQWPLHQFPGRGDIYWVKFELAIGSEIQKSPRPGLIVSGDLGNKRFNRVIVAPLTSKKVDRVYSFEIVTATPEGQCKILLDQIRSVDKIRLGDRIGSVDQTTMRQVSEVLKMLLELT
jgi:mRNA interferase MazF